MLDIFLKKIHSYLKYEDHSSLIPKLGTRRWAPTRYECPAALPQGPDSRAWDVWIRWLCQRWQKCLPPGYLT